MSRETKINVPKHLHNNLPTDNMAYDDDDNIALWYFKTGLMMTVEVEAELVSRCLFE